MKKKFALNALFILAIFISAASINTVSAGTSGKDSVFSKINDIDAVKGQLKGKADRFPYGSEKNKKVT